MGFVKTAAEIAEIEDILSNGRYSMQAISVEFLTTPEFMKEVLPPCFEPAEQPLAIAQTSIWQGAVCGECHCGIVYLTCRYKGQEGTTALWMAVSGDMPVTIGREMWGEGKKTGTAQIYFDGPQAYGYAERNGVRLIEIDADFDTDLGPNQSSWLDFEIKAQPHTIGSGLQNDVVITTLKSQDDMRRRLSGTAKLTLRGTQLDPLDEIPIVSVGVATYMEGGSVCIPQAVDIDPDRAAYMPYIYGQKYDDFRFLPIARRYRA